LINNSHAREIPARDDHQKLIDFWKNIPSAWKKALDLEDPKEIEKKVLELV
jgi:hypothetical protein